MGLQDLFYDWFGDWDNVKWVVFTVGTVIIIAGYLFIASRVEVFNLLKLKYIILVSFVAPAGVAFFINNPNAVGKKR